MELYVVVVTLCGLAQPVTCDKHQAIVKMHPLPYNCALHAQKIAKQYLREDLRVHRITCKPAKR